MLESARHGMMTLLHVTADLWTSGPAPVRTTDEAKAPAVSAEAEWWLAGLTDGSVIERGKNSNPNQIRKVLDFIQLGGAAVRRQAGQCGVGHGPRPSEGQGQFDCVNKWEPGQRVQDSLMSPRHEICVAPLTRRRLRICVSAGAPCLRRYRLSGNRPAM